MKEFSEEELAGCDGRDGRVAYVAVEGRVYDVSNSSMWRDGSHMKRRRRFPANWRPIVTMRHTRVKRVFQSGVKN